MQTFFFFNFLLVSIFDIQLIKKVGGVSPIEYNKDLLVPENGSFYYFLISVHAKYNIFYVYAFTSHPK
jgi:hypothetical protein